MSERKLPRPETVPMDGMIEVEQYRRAVGAYHELHDRYDVVCEM